MKVKNLGSKAVFVCVLQVCSSRPGEGGSERSGLGVGLVGEQHRQHPGGSAPKNPAAQQNATTPGRPSDCG